MKIKTIKEVVPEHTIEKETYVCETCGAEHDSSLHFSECSFCGKETCSNCRKYRVDYLEKLGIEDTYCTITFADKETHLVCACKDCVPRLNFLVKQKNSRMKALVKMVNEQLASLTLEKLDDLLS